MVDLLVKFYLSRFPINKVIKLAKKIDKSIFWVYNNTNKFGLCLWYYRRH